MLDERELGDAIGRLDHFRLGVAAGHDDMQTGSPLNERRDDFGERQIIVAKRDVELVEHEETDRWIGHHALGLSPRGARRRNIARAVLRLPGEAFAHRAPLGLGAEALDGYTLACRPGALDELHHTNAEATTKRPQRESERCCRLAFARTGVDDKQTFFEN